MKSIYQLLPALKKTLALFLFTLCCYTTPLFAQPALQWQHTYGSPGYELAFAINQTADGGYIVTGEVDSTGNDVTGYHGGGDCWVVKIDGNGTIQWQKALGGSRYERGKSVHQTADGGYIVGGFTASNDGDVSGNHSQMLDFWAVKLNGTGDIQWQKCLGGTGSDAIQDIIQTADGGYIATGESYSNNGDITNHHGSADCWVVRLDGGGNLLWQKSYGGKDWDEGESIAQLADGSYIMLASSGSSDGDAVGKIYGGHDYWLLKLDSSGDIAWQKFYGGSSNDEPFSLAPTKDGGYIMSGYSSSDNGNVTGVHGLGEDAWIVKVNSQGDIEWENCYGGSGFESAYSIAQTEDGGFIAGGYAESTDGDVTGNHGAYDAWIIKLDGSGNLQWQKSLGGSNDEFIYSIVATADGGCAAAGFTHSTDGDVIDRKDTVTEDFWIVKLASFSGMPETKPAENITVFPNPSTGDFTISLSNPIRQGIVRLYNITGEKVFEQTAYNEPLTSVHVKYLSKGIYFIKISGTANQYTQKVVVD